MRSVPELKNWQLETHRRYQEILERVQKRCVQSGRSVQQVVLIAVSKMQSIDKIEFLYRLGHRDFGENYAQDLLAKAHELTARGCKEIRWHFLGHLQRNKVKSLMPLIFCVHSVDSEKLGQELSRRWRELGRVEGLPIFVEVNLDQERSKSGVSQGEVGALVSGLSQIKNLKILGLMSIPSLQGGVREREISFKKLRDLEMTYRPKTLGCLSMGMTADFEIAISNGATHIRVGTAIFGQRLNVG